MSSTLCLIRQDPARGVLLRAIITCLAAGLLMRMMPDLGEHIAELAADDLPGGFAPMYLFFTALVATFVLGSNASTRSSRLALGLPLSTRRVWTVRTASLIGVDLVSISVLVAAMGLSVDLANTEVTMNPVIVLAAARAALTVVLMLFVFQLPQSERYSIPTTAPYVVYVIFSGGIILVFSSAAILSIAGTLIILFLTLSVGVWLYLRIPSTFSIGPTIAESQTPVWTLPDETDFLIAEPLGDDTVAVDRRHPVLGLHWVLFRGLKTNPLVWILLIAAGGSAAVVTAEFFKGANAFVPLFFLMIYHLPLLQTALETMTPYDPLPISRRLLWAHSVGPIILSVTLGVAISMTIFALNPEPLAHVRFDSCRIEVPWDYMELTPDGRVPTVTAPWGESFTPRAHSLWRGRTIALYDPFEVGPDNSPRFVELQMRRAVEAVYGLPVPAELSNPDHQPRPDFLDGVERGTFTLDMTRGRVSEDRNRSAAVALFILTLLGTGLMLLALLQFGKSVRRKVFKWAPIGFLLFLGVIVVAVFFARLLGFTEVWYVGALVSIGIRSLAQWLPLPTSVLWLFCVTLWVGAYLILERVFSTIEFPREKTMNRFAEEY